MTRIPVAILAVLLCCSLPVGVSAEGFLPGVPFLGGWCATSCGPKNCAAAGKVGYLGYNRGLVFEMGPVRQPVLVADGLLQNLRLQFPVEGIWVGASAGGGPQRGSLSACDPGDPLCLTIAGSWLFPNNKEGSEHDSYPILGNGAEDGLRTWRPNIQWYTLDAYVSRCMVANFSLIGGFRYDSFSTKFQSPSEAVNILGGPTDEGELVISSHIPYVGAVTRWGGVQVGVIGFPWVPGTILFRETIGYTEDSYIGRIDATGNYRNGYFLETFAEFGRQLQAVHLSVFATYTVLHAVGELDLSETGFNEELLQQSAPYAWGLDRQNWIVGGKAVIGFASPL